MKIGVSAKIDVKQIDKARLYKSDKGPIYLDITTFINIDDPDQYGQNGIITQNVTKAEKEQGVKGPILGNVKVFWRDEEPQQQEDPKPQPDDDIPW